MIAAIAFDHSRRRPEAGIEYPLRNPQIVSSRMAHVEAVVRKPAESTCEKPSASIARSTGSALGGAHFEPLPAAK